MSPTPPKIRLRAAGVGLASLAFLAFCSAAALRGGDGVRPLALIALGLGLSGGLYLAWIYLPDIDLPGASPRRGAPSPDGRPRVAITFDDGPNGAHTAEILDVLARHRVRATFFVVGEAVRRQPELVRRMHAEGHIVGSHTDSHRDLAWRSRAAIERELDATEHAIVAAGAPRPTWFRAPHGWKSPFLPSALKRRQLRLVAWTRGVWDTDRPGADVIAQRAIACLADRAILLLHDGTLGADRAQTAAALDRILSAAAARGITLVTVPEILTKPTDAHDVARKRSVGDAAPPPT